MSTRLVGKGFVSTSLSSMATPLRLRRRRVSSGKLLRRGGMLVIDDTTFRHRRACDFFAGNRSDFEEIPKRPGRVSYAAYFARRCHPPCCASFDVLRGPGPADLEPLRPLLNVVYCRPGGGRPCSRNDPLIIVVRLVGISRPGGLCRSGPGRGAAPPGQARRPRQAVGCRRRASRRSRTRAGVRPAAARRPAGTRSAARRSRCEDDRGPRRGCQGSFVAAVGARHDRQGRACRRAIGSAPGTEDRSRGAPGAARRSHDRVPPAVVGAADRARGDRRSGRPPRRAPSGAGVVPGAAPGAAAGNAAAGLIVQACSGGRRPAQGAAASSCAATASSRSSPAERCHELHADRQSLRCPVEGQRDRRLTGHVERQRAGAVRRRAHEGEQRLLGAWNGGSRSAAAAPPGSASRGGRSRSSHHVASRRPKPCTASTWRAARSRWPRGRARQRPGEGSSSSRSGSRPTFCVHASTARAVFMATIRDVGHHVLGLVERGGMGLLDVMPEVRERRGPHRSTAATHSGCVSTARGAPRSTPMRSDSGRRRDRRRERSRRRWRGVGIARHRTGGHVEECGGVAHAARDDELDREAAPALAEARDRTSCGHGSA